MLVGEVEFHIILSKVQNSSCIIAFCDRVFCQQLLPEVCTFNLTYPYAYLNLNSVTRTRKIPPRNYSFYDKY